MDTIPFKKGLTEQQKQGITALAAKPVSQWTTTDRANWNYATNGAKPPGTDAPKSGTAPSPDDISAQFNAIGIDTTNLSPEQLNVLGAMYHVMQSNADANKSMVPNTLSTKDMAQFLDQATKEIDPYYAEQLRIGRDQVLQSVADLTGEVGFQSQETLKQQANDRQALADQMAESGLAYSGIKNKAMSDLVGTQKGLVRSQAAQYSSQLRNLAQNFEQTYGKDELAKLKIPSLQYAGETVTSGNPLGVNFATQPAQEKVDISNRQTAIADNELAKRGVFSGTTNPYPITFNQ